MARDHNQTRTYPMSVDYIGDCVFALSVAGVGYNVWNSGAYGNGFEIALNHTISMTSYGEEIRVMIWPMGDQVQVTVYSKNAWPLQLVDMGRNEKNALEIFDAIETGRYLNHPVFLQMKQQGMAMAQQQGQPMPPQGPPMQQPQQGMPPQGQPMMQQQPQGQWQNMPPQGQGMQQPPQGMPMQQPPQGPPPQQWQNMPPQGAQPMSPQGPPMQQPPQGMPPQV